MLDFMRKNANSGVMLVLFGIIIFVFAINFGPWAGGNSSSSTPYAAKVNNKLITMANFRIAYSNQINQLKQFRPDYNQEQAEKDGLAGIILDQLISKELLYQTAKQHNFTVGARTLAHEIKTIVFGEKEAFSQEEYKKRIEGFFQINIAQFEEQIAKDLAAQQMADLLNTGIFVSDDDVKEAFLEQNNKVSVEFIKVKAEYFDSIPDATKEQIAAFVTNNAPKIEQYYKEHLSDYNKEAQIRASHILVKSAEGDSDKATKKEKAEALLKRINSGEDFATIAKAESDDPGSKIKGGDLDFFTKSMMVEEFSKAAFALKVGEVSSIVESPFGFHIIKVTDQKPAENLSLTDAQPAIATKLIKLEEQKRLAQELANKGLESLKTGMAIKDINLPGLINKQQDKQKDKIALNEPVADISSTFNKSSNYIPKVGIAPELIKEAFSLSLENKTASKVVESNNAFYAIRLKDKVDADLTKLEAEKETLKSRLLSTQKRQYLQQYITFLKSSAKVETNPELVSSKS